MPTLAERYDQQKQHRSLEETRRENPVPESVHQRVERGRERRKQGDAERDEIMQMWRGNQYVYRTGKGKIDSLPTVTDWENGQGKPPHRMRQIRNLMLDVVAHEVSAGTSRIPSMEVAPTTTDPDDIAAARLSERIALYGYDEWSLRQAAVKVITLAVLPGEGFAWPYFDNTVGPYFDDGSGNRVGIGTIKVRTFSGKQVWWEPGQKFDESRWQAVEVAMSEEAVREMDGFVGGELACDAEASSEAIGSGPDKPKNVRQVLVTHYLERPSPGEPNGRWLVMANGRQVVKQRAYPCQNHEGKVLDEPVLHKLSYFTDPDNDRDFGLGRFLMDPQRSLNDIVSRMLEWMKIAMLPQVFVQPGFLRRQKLTDEPNRVYEVNGDPNTQMRFREVDQPPEALFRMRDLTIEDFGRIAAQNDIPAQVESGKGIAVLNERDMMRRGEFIQQLAEWWSRLIRHCLYLVQRHYSEQDDRLIGLQGRFGPELIPGFKGADLRGQMDVRVSAASLEPQTREAIERRIMAYANLGWISPEAAMAAINGGTAAKLVESYELDVAWANRTIQKIVAGPDVLYREPPRVETKPDALTGVSVETEVPVWMPRKFQNVAVIKAVFEDWMKTQDYERLEPGMRDSADKIYDGLLSIEAEKAAQAAIQQQQQAEAYGQQNAAKPQMAKPNPSFPDVAGAGPRPPGS